MAARSALNSVSGIATPLIVAAAADCFDPVRRTAARTIATTTARLTHRPPPPCVSSGSISADDPWGGVRVLGGRRSSTRRDRPAAHRGRPGRQGRSHRGSGRTHCPSCPTHCGSLPNRRQVMTHLRRQTQTGASLKRQGSHPGSHPGSPQGSASDLHRWLCRLPHGRSKGPSPIRCLG